MSGRRSVIASASLCLIPLFGWSSAVVWAQSIADATAPYTNPKLSVQERVSDLLQRMTLDEKLSMLSGSGWMESSAVPRLHIPAIKMSDGPMGIRTWTGPSVVTNAADAVKFSSTAFPAGINLAASWDTALAREEGRAIGQEVVSVGRDMILGPTVNIQRALLWGRNFESFGEDPFLSGKIAVGYIQGVQGEGVIATVKHFAANNQEFERHRIDVAVDERALHEIYFPAFDMAIRDGDVWAVMSSYNKINGRYMAESLFLKQVLYGEFGFTGFVISDWGSTYSSVGTVNAGMALEMPGGPPMRSWLDLPSSKNAGNDGGYLIPEKLKPLVQAGSIAQANVDENVGRILTIIFKSGLFDHPHGGGEAIDTAAQRVLARKVADEGIVLLKNQNNILPLNAGTLHSIAVIGPSAFIARPGGGGSGLVYSKDVVTPLAGIQKRAGKLDVHYALGVAMPGEDEEQATPDSRKKLLDAAVAAATASDVAIVFVGYSSKLETEGNDRSNMDLPSGQNELIEAVAAANKNTIVVLNAGDSVGLTKWIDQVPGLIDAWYGGEEEGSAIADILFGDVNPSGKLPFTFLRKLQDSPSYPNYPGKNLHVKYAEGIYVGYRYFDKHKEIAPLFPFGFGLSYTNFALSELKLPEVMRADDPTVTAQVTVENTGARKGAEVVQLYVGEPNASVDRPLRELKGFERVELAPGERNVVSFALDRRSLSFYSVATHSWVPEPGQFDISVGSSSRDLSLSGSFRLER
jgi:beta-glucosidase